MPADGIRHDMRDMGVLFVFCFLLQQRGLGAAMDSMPKGGRSDGDTAEVEISIEGCDPFYDQCSHDR